MGGNAVAKLSGPLMGRVATAPISWGICEVPNWGEQLPADRVAAEMAECGFSATELGEFGFFADTPDQVVARLSEHDLSLIGGFVSLELHNPAVAQANLDHATDIADFFVACGATHFNSAAITDPDWTPRRELSGAEWQHLYDMLGRVDQIVTDRGLKHVLHPHLETVIETGDEILGVAENTDIDFVLDTAHFAAGGLAPLAFVEQHAARIGLVHLKDLCHDVADKRVSESLSLLHAVQQGMFETLGQGDLPIDDVVVTLEQSGYDDWYVLEQDVALTNGVPAQGSGPIEQVRLSLDYLAMIETDRLGD